MIPSSTRLCLFIMNGLSNCIQGLLDFTLITLIRAQSLPLKNCTFSFGLFLLLVQTQPYLFLLAQINSLNWCPPNGLKPSLEFSNASLLSPQNIITMQCCPHHQSEQIHVCLFCPSLSNFNPTQMMMKN